MTTHPRTQQAVGLLTIAAAIVALHHLGGGALALPHSRSTSAVAEWAQRRDPVTVGFAVIRLVALVVAYHLATTTAIGLAGRIMSLPSWVSAAEAWTLPPLRTTWGRLAGLGLSATAVLTAPVPPSTAASLPDATMRVIETSPPGSPGSATMRMVDGRPTPTPTTTTMSAEPRTEAVVAEPETDQHEVRPGDHLWAIAADRMSDHLGRPASDGEVAGYWRRVIAANPQVVDPDLIHPGQIITVPPVPAG